MSLSAVRGVDRLSVEVFFPQLGKQEVKELNYFSTWTRTSQEI